MTDFDAATAWTTGKRAGAFFCIVLTGIALAGCESASSILGGNQLATETVAPQPPPVPAKPQLVAKLALAPVIGAPDAIGQQMRAQLTQAAERNKIGILADRDPQADFGMRGYLVAARDRGGIKVSYIWDVTDTSGKRVNRITGEETTAVAAGAKDPWGSVSPTVTQAIADKVASSLGAWAPTQAKPQAVPVASAVPYTGVPSGAGAGGIVAAPPAPEAPAVAVAAPPVAPPTVTNTTTASLPGSSGMPSVSGAPGDGNTALASALNRELTRQGMPVDRQTGQAYRVEGQVSVGAVKDGRQAIQIDWRVKDGKGSPVGTVTQKNSIPPGSLDGAWGQTADAAAAAAAQGILKLLPQQAAAKATN